MKANPSSDPTRKQSKNRSRSPGDPPLAYLPGDDRGERQPEPADKRSADVRITFWRVPHQGRLVGGSDLSPTPIGAGTRRKTEYRREPRLIVSGRWQVSEGRSGIQAEQTQDTGTGLRTRRRDFGQIRSASDHPRPKSNRTSTWTEQHPPTRPIPCPPLLQWPSARQDWCAYG